MSFPSNHRRLFLSFKTLNEVSKSRLFNVRYVSFFESGIVVANRLIISNNQYWIEGKAKEKRKRTDFLRPSPPN